MDRNTRLDFEIYVMGEMKYEFINFLTECYKENFIETLSWGNFRRYQLVIGNEDKWLNVYFIFLKNEMNADILINSFKIYEKRNFTLLLYNIHEQKSEKNIDMLNENLIFERNKFYEGILNEESISENLTKINAEEDDEDVISTDRIKGGLKFLTDNEDNLIFKVGFSPSKKTKGKRESVNYSIKSEVFMIEDEEEAVNFCGLMNNLLNKYFDIFMISNKKEDFMNIADVKTEKVDSKTDRDMMGYLVKVIDWFIVIYLIACFYKFLYTDY
jgi:hypothetical protein